MDAPQEKPESMGSHDPDLQAQEESHSPEDLSEAMSRSNSTHIVSSRLAKREQKKLSQQIIMFLVGAVAIVLLFWFVVLPATIKFVASLGGSENTGGDDTLPPQVPIFSAPLTATSSAKIILSGFGEAGSELVILQGGTEKTRVTIGDDGSFGLTMQLEPGENVLSGYSVDQTGNESAESKRYTVVFDDEPPELEITEPVDGANITLRKNQLTTIKGTTDENARVELNGRLVYASADGTFSTTYQLSEGDNQLLFKAIDEAGNTTEKTIKVTFSL
jgi:hypothetical protein